MKKLVLLFPGVGSQHVGMGKEFYDNFKVVRETFEEAGAVLGTDLAKLCFETASKEELAGLVNSQSALLAVCVAFYRVYLQEIGKLPQYGMGHSLGEYSALCCAGVLEFADALVLVRERGNILKETAASMDGLMAWVINLDNNIVRDVCEAYSREEQKVYVSALDAPTQSSISGMKADIWKVGGQLVDRGGIVYPLKLSGPFHSPYMTSAANRIEALLEQYRFGKPAFTVIANRSGLPYDGNREDVARNLAEQLINPLRWQDSIQYLEKRQVEMAVEIGPDRVLKHLVQNNSDSMVTFSFRDMKDLKTLHKELT